MGQEPACGRLALIAPSKAGVGDVGEDPPHTSFALQMGFEYNLIADLMGKKDMNGFLGGADPSRTPDPENRIKEP